MDNLVVQYFFHPVDLLDFHNAAVFSFFTGSYSLIQAPEEIYTIYSYSERRCILWMHLP